MSSGQKSRTPEHFPLMKYRALKRDVRVCQRPGLALRIEFGDIYSREWLSANSVRDRLTELWEQKKFPRYARTPLDACAGINNPYWEIMRLVPASRAWPWGDPWPVAWCSIDYEGPTRASLVMAFAWSIPSPSDVVWMRDILDGRGVVEIGAGNGYWAWQLRQAGVDVVAFDNGDLPWAYQWSPVENGNTGAVRGHADRALVLIWPPCGSSMARVALDSYGGDLLIYAGEGEGGCTADAAFHEELDRAWDEIETAPHHPTFEGIHCRLIAYRRRVAE